MAALKVEPGRVEITKIFLDHEMEAVGPPLTVD